MLFGTRRKTQRQIRLGIESMEERVVPATINVANVAQLQAAIASVNDSAKPNTIVLASKNYSLPGALTIQNAADLTIKVVDGKTGTLTGEGLDRVLTIQGSKVSIDGVGISGGGSVQQGGAIYANTSYVSLRNSTVSGSAATQAGGGIYSLGGTLVVDHSTISGNKASSDTVGFGGGIAAVNTIVTVSASSILDNQAVGYDQLGQHAVLAGGGGIYVQGGTLTVSSSSLSNNGSQAVTNGTDASASGGAIQSTDAAVQLKKTTFSSNNVNTFSTKTYSPRGGAVSSTGGSLTITNSTFTANNPDTLHGLRRPGLRGPDAGDGTVQGSGFVPGSGFKVQGSDGRNPERRTPNEPCALNAEPGTRQVLAEVLSC